MRDLEGAAAQGNADAALALDVFTYQVKKTIGAYAAAMGGLAGINAARLLRREALVTPPLTTAHGCLVNHVALSDPRHFQPMNTNFGLFPPLPNAPRDKEAKRRLIAKRALEDFESWKTRSRLS